MSMFIKSQQLSLSLFGDGSSVSFVVDLAEPPVTPGFEAGYPDSAIISLTGSPLVVGAMSQDWFASRSYVTNQVIIVDGHPSLAAQATTGGTSGGSWPFSGASVGQVITDGSISWTIINAPAQNLHDSPSISASIHSSLLTITFSSAPKQDGSVITDTFGNSITISGSYDVSIQFEYESL